MNTYTLGISCGYHDSAVTLLLNGRIVAAVQEERFTRIKQDASFPTNALKYCLKEAGISLSDVHQLYYYENPNKKIKRLICTYLSHGFKGFNSFVLEMPAWASKKVRVKKMLNAELAKVEGTSSKLPKISYIDHHESHAAAAFFPSPFEEAAVLCVDGVGEWATTSAWVGKGNQLKSIWEIRFPHSLGLLYSAITYFCGFKVDSGEYKLMGLAPYGEPLYYDIIKNNLIDIKADGSFWLNMDYFSYTVGSEMTNQKFAQLFGSSRRLPEALLTKREYDLAASIQVVLEEVMLLLSKNLRQQTGIKNLCMSGGVALNCVANGKILSANIFDNIWVQPASGDSGGSLGAALAGWHTREDQQRAKPNGDMMQGALLGSSYSNTQIEQALKADNAVFEYYDDEHLYPFVADRLAEGCVMGWFQDRMEFGPRSLGARSIIGDARDTQMQSKMNLKIKNRESFRPFAPAVLEEHASDWFKMDRPSPYMLFVVGVQDHKRHPLEESEKSLTGIERLNCIRSTIPAVTHIDYSARVQTVSKKENSSFRKLLEHFYRKTDCPVLVNTSFNVRGEPIVENPHHAYVCFMRTQMDYLVIGNYVMNKAIQPKMQDSADWRSEFVLD